MVTKLTCSLGPVYHLRADSRNFPKALVSVCDCKWYTRLGNMFVFDSVQLHVSDIMFELHACMLQIGAWDKKGASQ